jgi:flavin reductase (DIM6/NTAB) family NADH-FMN oxidoreductase RutF
MIKDRKGGIIMIIDLADLDHKESHDLLVGCVVPRPIAFVSTVGVDGVFNVAPFSFFSPLSTQPPLVGFGIGVYRDGRKKDTLVNIQSSGEFVISVVHEDLAEAMNKASTDWPIEISEFEKTGLTPVKADRVKAPLVGESPINMECHLKQIIDVGDAMRRSDFVIGEVLRVHIKDEFFSDGEVQMAKLKAIGRLGAELYCRTTDIFEMKRPYILK